MNGSAELARSFSSLPLKVLCFPHWPRTHWLTLQTMICSMRSRCPSPRVRRILVPNPAAFLVQKILIHEKRNHGKRAKDILYIQDTIETFGGNLPAIREQWQTNVRPALHAKAARLVEHATEESRAQIEDTDSLNTLPVCKVYRGPKRLTA